MAEVMAEVVEAEEKGKTIFLDVFRRADKRDDGTLSWAEFSSFFSDGILSTEDLQKLFNDIDTHDTNNLDTSELCEFFLKEAGPFSQVFAGLEDMNKAVGTALLESSKEYSNQSITGKFISRFLLKEILCQLATLGHHVEVAGDTIADMENEQGSSDDQKEVPTLKTRTRRNKQVNFSQQTSVDASAVKNFLSQEVNRLSDLITKLENKVRFNIVEYEEYVASVEENTMAIVVSRKFHVAQKGSTSFISNLGDYINATRLQAEGIINFSLQRLANTTTVILYEIWKGSDELHRHYCSEISKTFMHNNIDHLEQPEEYSKMAVPASWIIRVADVDT